MFGVVIDMPLFTCGIDDIQICLLFPDFTFAFARRESEKVNNGSLVR